MSTTENLIKQGHHHKELLERFIARLEQICQSLTGAPGTPPDEPSVTRDGIYGFFNAIGALQSDYSSQCQTISNQLTFLEEHLGIQEGKPTKAAPKDNHRFREKLLTTSLSEALDKDLAKETF